MLEQTDTVFGGDSSYQYKLGGVFYDEDQKLTVSLVATSKEGEAKKSLKRVHKNGDDRGNAVGSIVDKDTAHIPIFYAGTTNPNMVSISSISNFSRVLLHANITI